MMKAACRTRVISARTILLVVAHNMAMEKGRMTMNVISSTFIVPLPLAGLSCGRVAIKDDFTTKL